MTLPIGSAYLNSLNGTSGTSSGSAAATKDNSQIDQSGFLKLLTTQLQTQDPTAPTDNSQMIAQMASFSQLSGITEMNSSLKSMASDLSASRFGDASGWIGRAALVSSSTASQMSNGAYAGQVTLPSDATDVSVNLVDGNGQTVKTIDLGAQKSGTANFAWDGKDTAGKLTDDGALKVQVTATGADGRLTTDLATWTEINSVQSPATGSTKLITSLGNFSPSDVQQLT